MVVWIIVGVVVLALAVFAFWPRKRAITRDAQNRTEGEVQNYSQTRYPHY
jgi:hypothetical protein